MRANRALRRTSLPHKNDRFTQVFARHLVEQRLMKESKAAIDYAKQTVTAASRIEYVTDLIEDGRITAEQGRELLLMAESIN